MKLEDDAVQVATIGFTGKTAQRFFDSLKQAQIRTVLDVRLHNTSQLAGFAKSRTCATSSRICAARRIWKYPN